MTYETILKMKNDGLLEYEFLKIGIPENKDDTERWLKAFLALRNKVLNNGECISESELMCMQIEARQKKEQKIKELQDKYKQYNSFEIFKPLPVNEYSYRYNKQLKQFNKFLVDFNITDSNIISIRFNKADIDIFKLDELYNDCANAGLRMQQYLTN